VNPGWKFNEWELAGVPVRLELGPREMKSSEVMAVRRTTRAKEKIKIEDLAARLPELLVEVQKEIFELALKRREENCYAVDTWEDFKKVLEEKGGFLISGWCGSRDCEDRIQEETKATIRCIPLDVKTEIRKWSIMQKLIERRRDEKI
jgi:prolyl-tRNA synthetase